MVFFCLVFHNTLKLITYWSKKLRKFGFIKKRSKKSKPNRRSGRKSGPQDAAEKTKIRRVTLNALKRRATSKTRLQKPKNILIC